MNSTCKVYNRTAQNVDEFRCGLMKLEAHLYYFDFGYISMGPLALIVVISIFGKIKENYRWLILNQAIWDLFLSTNYGCYNAINIGVKPAPSCFYWTRTYFPNVTNFSRNLDYFLVNTITYNSFSSLLLLTILRFLTLYFPRIYDKLTKGKRICSAIIFFNIFCLLFDLNPVFSFFQVDRMNNLLDKCELQKNASVCWVQKDYLTDSWYKFHQSLGYTFLLIQYFQPILFMFVSIIATIFIMLKIVKQAKFQSKHNRNDFSASLRITIVICLQTSINCFAFVIEAFCKFIPEIISHLKLKIRTSRNNVPDQDYTGYLDLRLPLWFDSLTGLTSDDSKQLIVQFRILIEAFIILAIMTGYREALMDIVKLFYHKIIRHPVRTFKSLCINKSKVSATTIF